MFRTTFAIIGLLVCVSASQASIVYTSPEGNSSPSCTVSRPASHEECCSWSLWRDGNPHLVTDVGTESAISGGSLAIEDGQAREKLPDPEPTTLVIWALLGLTWTGLKCFRDKRRGVSTGGGRGSGRSDRLPASPFQHGPLQGRGRQPWSDHARAAILEIIERGSCH